MSSWMLIYAIVLFVDCVHNISSRNSCQETLHSKKPSLSRFSKRGKRHERDKKSDQPAGDKRRCHRCDLTNHTGDHCRYKVKSHKTGHLQSGCPNGKPSLKPWKERQRVCLSLIRRAWLTRFLLDWKNLFSPPNGQFVVGRDNGERMERLLRFSNLNLTIKSVTAKLYLKDGSLSLSSRRHAQCLAHCARGREGARKDGRLGHHWASGSSFLGQTQCLCTQDGWLGMHMWRL